MDLKKKNLKLLIGSCLVLTFFSAASFYTYSYLKAQKDSTINVSLNKGSVKFTDVISDSGWTYIENSPSENLSSLIEIPKQVSTQNLDIGLKKGDSLGESIANDRKPLVVKEPYDGFYNVKSGDIFMRKIELKYDGNSADFTIKLDSKTYKFADLKNNFDIYCAVDYTDVGGTKQDKLWFDNGTTEIKGFVGTLSKSGTQPINLRILYRCKSTSLTNFDTSAMDFNFKVQNYLKTVGGSAS